jgi:hypothetical protein
MKKRWMMGLFGFLAPILGGAVLAMPGGARVGTPLTLQEMWRTTGGDLTSCFYGQNCDTSCSNSEKYTGGTYTLCAFPGIGCVNGTIKVCTWHKYDSCATMNETNHSYINHSCCAC